MTDLPTPQNNSAMADLHTTVQEWARRHGFDGLSEVALLSGYLAGRLNVQVSLGEIRKLKDLYADDYHA